MHLSLVVAFTERNRKNTLGNQVYRRYRGTRERLVRKRTNAVADDEDDDDDDESLSLNCFEQRRLQALKSSESTAHTRNTHTYILLPNEVETKSFLFTRKTSKLGFPKSCTSNTILYECECQQVRRIVYRLSSERTTRTTLLMQRNSDAAVSHPHLPVNYTR